MSESTLYKSLHEERFFYVPDHTPFPAGDFVVRSLSGKEIATQALVLEIFEIPQEEAQRITREQLLALTGRFKSFLHTTARLLNNPTPNPEQREVRIAEALQLGKEQVRQDPDAMAGAMKKLVAGVVGAARESIESPEVGRERLKDIAGALKQEGISPETTEAVEQLPEQLRILLGSEDTLKKIEAATQQLREAADKLTESLTKKAEKPGP